MRCTRSTSRRGTRLLVALLLVILPAAGVLGTRAVGKALAQPTDTITATADAGGSISPSGQVQVAEGSDQAFTITPDPGYQVSDVVVDDTSLGPVTSYTFTAVDADHTISASFAIDTYTITPSTGPNGAISPATPQTADYGDTPTFTITPDPGYHVADVLVDGTSVGPVTSYQFTAVDSDHTISASFAIDTYTLTYTPGAHGTISGASPQTVNWGASGSTVTAVPATGYHFVTWSDGLTTASRTDSSVTADLSVTAIGNQRQGFVGERQARQRRAQLADRRSSASSMPPTGCTPAWRRICSFAGWCWASKTQTWLTSAKSWSSVASQKTGTAGRPCPVSHSARRAACSAL